MKRWTQFAAVLVPQVLVLAGMVARAEMTAREGVRVVLEVQPYDSMDLLVGRYINARLAIERIDTARVPAPQPPPALGRTVFVQLEEREGLWQPLAVYEDRPKDGDVVAIRGRVTGVLEPDELLVDYKRDRFYIPDDGNDPTVVRNEGGELPKSRLVLRVDRYGRSIVEDFLVDGRPYAEWNRDYEARKDR